MKDKITLIPYSLEGWSLATRQTLRNIAKFPTELGFKPYCLYLPNKYTFTKDTNKMLKNIVLLKLRGEHLLFPYPPGFWMGITKFSRIYKSILEDLMEIISKRFNSFIIYVYDLPIEQIGQTGRDGRRNISALDYLIEEKLFETADKILVFNKAMEEVLRGRYRLPKSKFVHFEILDMGVDFVPPIKKSLGKARDLVYVGNLFKNRIEGLESTLHRVPPNVRLNFIGPNGEWLKGMPHINYLGTRVGTEFYQTLSNSDFGILWYSSTLSHYFRLSSSAKFSSYMIAGLPVLVDKHAQWPAELVKKYKVGIVADNFEKLLYKASNIDEDKYLEMRKNALFLGEKIRKGYFIKRALKEAIGEH